MSLVLDSSATLAWIYKEECSPAIDSVFALVLESKAWVPGLWRLEVANVLQLGVRRGRNTAEFRDRALTKMQELSIYQDDETSERAWNDTLRLADRHRLTMYDATYLELALRRDLPLATLDRLLRLAAQNERVTLLGL